MNEAYYKVLNDDGSCFHGGNGKWPLPSGKRPGKWMPKIDKIAPCQSGYHILKREHVVGWLGPAIFEVEVRGDVVWADDKGVAQQARLVRKLETWNDKTARLFACDCADAVRHLMNKRSTDAIDVARRFANGLATQEELAAAEAAARAAAGAAARAAARAATGAAARAAARDAAGDAAWAAAWDAARAAAEAAAWAAARAAQTANLFEYLEGRKP